MRLNWKAPAPRCRLLAFYPRKWPDLNSTRTSPVIGHPPRPGRDSGGNTLYLKGLASALTIIAVMTGSIPVAGDEGPQPSIMMPKMRYDFGKVFEKEKYAYSFPVRNMGQADLVIESVKPGCGCTVVDFDEVVHPGQEGKINMVVDGNQVHGTFAKSAKVNSNDPEHPVMTITIAGEEVPYINVVPEGRVFLQGRYGEKVERQVRLSSNEEGLDFKVTGVRSNIDHQITYRVDPGDAEREWVLSVFKNPALPTGTNFGTIYVKTNSEKAPEKVVQVQVITKGAITVQPTALNYGRVKFDPERTGEPVTKTVTVLSPKEDFEILEVTTSSNAYQASVTEEMRGQRYKIDVTFTPPKKTKTRQTELGEMTIKTNDPHEPTLRVKLVARSF